MSTSNLCSGVFSLFSVSFYLLLFAAGLPSSQWKMKRKIQRALLLLETKLPKGKSSSLVTCARCRNVIVFRHHSGFDLLIVPAFRIAVGANNL